ncbi:hypothetical protein BDV98DRAFT_104981 [Pterulicium gracile]|uniref:Asl1-like glycosyl hydrolase catalytic domain-containing protein n=1 Tax=Pterulicium gracile TaxID=1884261 RepID=A0A5C3QK04_9AGAR|nr:hypothetical protein BDV98DRAFT_104981 [Pterula gracilis]
MSFLLFFSSSVLISYFSIYTWSPWCPQGAKGLGFDCAPMLWGDKHIDPWVKNVINGPDNYAKYALGMNEPNEKSQANIDPWHAAGLWQQYIQPLKNRGYTLISPACTNGPDGKEWMKNFIDACKGCTIDAIAVHYYGTSAQGMIDHSEDYFNTFGKPIWITEAACQDFSGRNQQCNQGQIFDFMNKVKGYVNSSPHVQTFFPFGVMHDMYNVNPLNQLMSGSGQPTDLGWSFLG